MEVMNEFHKGCLGGIEEVEVRLGSERMGQEEVETANMEN